jgi:hypothetical protein
MKYVMPVIFDARAFRFTPGDLAYRVVRGKLRGGKLDPDWRS